MSSLRIAILGADSSHVEAYTDLLHRPDSPYHGRGRVVALWGQDPDQAHAKAATLGIPFVAATPQEALQEAEAVLVEARYGDEHAPLAEMALRVGLPTFVDKPLTNAFSEAASLLALAQAQGVPLFSCSPLRYALEISQLSADLALHAPWLTASFAGLAAYPSLGERASNLYFYGIHLVEMMLAVLGTGFTALAYQKGRHSDSALVRHEDGRLVTLHFLRDCAELYQANVYTQQAILGGNVDAWGDFYPRTLGHILTCFETRHSPLPPTEMLEAIRLLSDLEALKNA
jgi:predicted dehydrogenase